MVDDDPDVLQLLSRMLHTCAGPLAVATASSGKEALGMMRSELPDLVLLDIAMADMDGWQVLESMAKDEGMRNVPVFFVSAQDPADQPPASRFLLATLDSGISLSKLLRCSMEISAILLETERELDLAPV